MRSPENSENHKLFLGEHPETGVSSNYWNEWNIPPTADKKWIIKRYSKGLQPYGNRQNDVITEKNKQRVEKINLLVDEMNAKIKNPESCSEEELKVIINEVRNLIFGDNYAWFQEVDIEKSKE